MTNIQNIVPSVTVGIPAYNEEANIGYLLQDVLKQKTSGFTLEKIIVVSDGSTDNTATIVQAASDNRVILIDDGERHGQAMRQNNIIAQTDTDILVLLNADILLPDEQYLGLLIAPLITGQADFTGGNTDAIVPQNFFERILWVSDRWKRHMTERWRQGNNVYTCKGAARAFSRAYYQKIIFPKSIGEDAYSYFFGVTNHFRYQYVPEALAWMKLPDFFKDHAKQSLRFRQSKKALAARFGEQFIERQYQIPCRHLIGSGLVFFFKYPLPFLGYLTVYAITVCQSFFSRPISDTWNMSTSSKKLK